MDTLTAGLLRTCAIAHIENLPHLHSRGDIGWDALNAARGEIMKLLGEATGEDRTMLTGLLVRLG
ncbi:hypothetical protein [Sphingomonas olei]|uniref:Uncharacterized protein n=1 Tax=Sphingomonas olei TaxID=1886787 RepID=A0ABY2QHY0_9SPHN|nr:hypothetical protein [Sphingomonas olei]THG40414.1 hypothetical protein E5988_06170 [Sphingomonas olei]